MNYVSILIEELGLNSLPGNPTYNLTDFSASDVLDNHTSVLTSIGLDPKEYELDLQYIYWIRKMLHRASIHSSYKAAYTYKARSSEVLQNSLF